MRSPWIAGLALTGMMLSVACGVEGNLKRVEDEVGDLKLEVYKLRSQVEEANRKADAEHDAGAVARTQDRRFQADLQETMRQLQDATRVLSTRLGDGRSMGPAAQPVVRSGKSANSAEGPGVSEDEKAFNAAMLDYNRGNYALASDGLNLFLKAYPQSPRRPDAMFTVGLCWFNQKVYDKARATFEQILKEFATSSQFLPAKLKRAQCQDRMGMKPAAIKSYKELVEGFPGSPEARTAQQELTDLGF